MSRCASCTASPWRTRSTPAPTSSSSPPSSSPAASPRRVPGPRACAGADVAGGAGGAGARTQPGSRPGQAQPVATPATSRPGPPPRPAPSSLSERTRSPAPPHLCRPRVLPQMIALRYGTVPVVRSTGGLADTVKDLDSPAEVRCACCACCPGAGLPACCRRAPHARLTPCPLPASAAQAGGVTPNGFVFDGIDAGSLNSGGAAAERARTRAPRARLPATAVASSTPAPHHLPTCPSRLLSPLLPGAQPWTARSPTTKATPLSGRRCGGAS